MQILVTRHRVKILRLTEGMNEQSMKMTDEDCHHNDSETEFFDFDETCDESRALMISLL